MGANAATKCLRVVNNVEKVLAIRLMTAVQAMEFRTTQNITAIRTNAFRFQAVISFMKTESFTK